MVEHLSGLFLEPITLWEPPTRLAFDVTERPPAMVETNLFGKVLPAHLNIIPESKRGEFRLIKIDDNSTLIEGRTWYNLNAQPELYWGLWADWIIGKIHMRVLYHIAQPS